MLNLPDTATDIELIVALVELVAGFLQQKYEALLADAATAGRQADQPRPGRLPVT